MSGQSQRLKAYQPIFRFTPQSLQAVEFRWLQLLLAFFSDQPGTDQPVNSLYSHTRGHHHHHRHHHKKKRRHHVTAVDPENSSSEAKCGDDCEVDDALSLLLPTPREPYASGTNTHRTEYGSIGVPVSRGLYNRDRSGNMRNSRDSSTSSSGDE